MQTLALRALAVKSPINASKSCLGLTERIAQTISHTRPAVSYNISRSVHARHEELSDPESAMDAQKKPDAEGGAKTCHSYRDDMADSFGDAYSTRSSDEGFGGIYATVEHDANAQVQHVYDQSQGSEVREKKKEKATQHTAFPAHNRHTRGGFGGTAT